MPAASASACASLAHVTAFHGHVALTYTASASGSEPSDGALENITLSRKATSLDVALTDKQVSKVSSHLVLFTGKVRGGTVAVDDSYSQSLGTDSASGTFTHTGPADAGDALVAINTSSCKYQFGADYLVYHGTYAGDESLSTSGGASGGAVGEREQLPANLHLVGGAGPDADSDCSTGPLLVSLGLKPCFEPGGGWWTDFQELYLCRSLPPTSGCDASKPGPFGSASLVWVLMPTYAKTLKPKKQKT
ncbi:MAG TPA: hypothetical protein VMT10_09315 [Solirubrobacteraceae bacterium]|nr:hypothetical protein [Solirubrobacteraceae bacterium]